MRTSGARNGAGVFLQPAPWGGARAGGAGGVVPRETVAETVRRVVATAGGLLALSGKPP